MPIACGTEVKTLEAGSVSPMRGESLLRIIPCANLIEFALLDLLFERLHDGFVQV
jgi:hypothetical protein